jgi:hypothetical protein
LKIKECNIPHLPSQINFLKGERYINCTDSLGCFIANFNGEESLSIVPTDVEFQPSILDFFNRRSPFESTGGKLIITVNFLDFRDNPRATN